MKAPKFRMVTIVLDAATLAHLENMAEEAGKERLETISDLLKLIVEDDRAAHNMAEAAE